MRQVTNSMFLYFWIAPKIYFPHYEINLKSNIWELPVAKSWPCDLLLTVTVDPQSSPSQALRSIIQNIPRVSNLGVTLPQLEPDQTYLWSVDKFKSVWVPFFPSSWNSVVLIKISGCFHQLTCLDRICRPKQCCFSRNRCWHSNSIRQNWFFIGTCTWSNSFDLPVSLNQTLFW